MSARIYYYPGGAGQLRDINLGEPLSLLEPQRVIGRADTVSYSGRRYSSITSGTIRARFVLDRFSLLTSAGALLYRSLMSLEAHLQAGGMLLITGDSTKAFVAQLASTPSPQQTSLYDEGQIYGWLPGSLSAGDVIITEPSYPDTFSEHLAIDSRSAAGVIALSNSQGVRYEYTTEPVIIREQHTYPAMKLPDDQIGRSIVTNDRGITATLDFTLELDRNALAQHARQSANAYDTTSTDSGISFEAAAAESPGGYMTIPNTSIDLTGHQSGYSPTDFLSS